MQQYTYKYQYKPLVTQRKKMTITKFMLSLLERLAKMFPQDTYQRRLEAFLRSRGATDTASLEGYIKEYEYKNHKEF